MLDRLPQLRYLNVKLDPPDSEDSNDDGDEDEMFADDSDDAPSPETFRLLNLHSLLIESYGISSGFIKTHLLPRMPNLRYFSIICPPAESIDLFAVRGQTAILTHVPLLRTFRFYVSNFIIGESPRAGEILASTSMVCWS